MRIEDAMKTLGRWLLVVVLLVMLGAAVLYERPIWVQTQMIHGRLLVARVQSNYVLTPAGRVHYYEAEPGIPGGGVPLVLVHGLGDRDESWEPMLVRLKRAGFHVYAPDLLGYGRSPRPEGSDYSITTQEQFVADFIRALGLPKTDVGGWSMGGWIVLKLALDHPEMVDRVVVYDGAGMRFEPNAAAALFHPTDGEQLQHLADLLEPGGKPLPGYVRRDVLRVMAENQWIVDKNIQSMETGKDVVGERLAGLTEPLLLVWGGEDKLLPLALGEQMHGLDPRSELDIVEGCGHLAPKTCPARVAAATADFLRANPVPEGGVRTLANMR